MEVHIGKVLAQYSEDVAEWPQEKIFSIIEKINSDILKRNYSTAMFNKRGFSSRGPYDGGNIERKHAEYFKKLHKDYRNKYPNVAEIFKGLADGYSVEAKKMDDKAERDKLEY